MKSIRLFSAIKERPSLTLLLTVTVFFITPLIQSINTPLAFEIWFRELIQKPLSVVTYGSFSFLFGMFIPLYLYTKNKCLDCKKEDARPGFAASILGFMLGVCPACFSFIGFLLPLGTSIFLTTYSHLFTGLSIVIILFSIFKLGGFKKEIVVKQS
jgi:membrane protease YdiL (CAAX protease family)